MALSAIVNTTVHGITRFARMLAMSRGQALRNRDRLESPASPTLHARKQLVVRDAIWEAAMDLIAEKGYDETTVEDIAVKAGVSRRSFFRYFSSKSDLMAYNIIGYAALLAKTIDECPSRFSLPEVFRHTIRHAAQQCVSNSRARKVMAIAAKYPAAREAHQTRAAELQDRVREAYLRRLKKRSKENLTPAVLAALTISILNIVFESWFAQSDSDISIVCEKVLATVQLLAS
jgi:AcrR family transcriptional regulator